MLSQSLENSEDNGLDQYLIYFHHILKPKCLAQVDHFLYLISGHFESIAKNVIELFVAIILNNSESSCWN